MDKAQSCPVCCNPWTHDQSTKPVALPACGHSFCRHCLVTLYRRDQCIKCPTCRREYIDVNPDDLPANFALLDMIAANEEKNDSQDGDPSTPGADDETPPKKLPTPGADDETPPKKLPSGLIKGAAIGGAAVLGGVTLVAAAPFVLTAVGFTSAGIAAGSWAASMMSAAAVANGGGVVAGGVVATLQSLGAAGLGAAATAAVGTTGAAVGVGVGAGVVKVADTINKKKKGDEPSEGNGEDGPPDEPPGGEKGDEPPAGEKGDEPPAGEKGDEPPAGEKGDEPPAGNEEDQGCIQADATHARASVNLPPMRGSEAENNCTDREEGNWKKTSTFLQEEEELQMQTALQRSMREAEDCKKTYTSLQEEEESQIQAALQLSLRQSGAESDGDDGNGKKSSDLLEEEMLMQLAIQRSLESE